MKTLVFLLVVCTSVAALFAQTRGPMPLRRTQPDSVRVLLDTVYSNGPDFAIGWNWGASLRPVNKAFGTNAWHLNNPFEWSDYNSNRPRDPMNMLDTSLAMHLLVAPSKNIDTLYYESQYKWFWDERFIDGAAKKSKFTLNYGSSAGVSLTEAIGFRFHPELSMADTIGFTPRVGDKQGAIWGFLDKDTVIGKLTTDTTNPNFNSYALDADTVTQWHTVLNNSWPQQRLGMWTKDTSFAATAPFNGKKMYLTLQLRRTDATDTAMTADSVLRIKIHYATCDDNTTIREIAFDSLPSPTAGNIALPFRQPDPISPEADATRGMVRPLVADPFGSREIIITRNMIPRSDSVQRDVAIMGHFLLMQKNFGTILAHSNPFLRSESVNNMIGPKEATDAANSIYHISRMWVEVEYRGNCDVAIDWVQLGTDNYTRLTQGYYDSAICVNAKNIVAKLDSNNQHRFGNANHPNRTRIWRWYNRDEGGDMFWDGMAYTHKLLDSHTLYENGVATTYKRQLYSSGMSAVWEGTGCKVTSNALAPMYNYGYKGNGDSVASYMGLRRGVRDTEDSGRILVDYETHPGRPDTVFATPYSTTLPLVGLDAYPRTAPYGGSQWMPEFPYGIEEGNSLQACFERVRWDLKKRSNYLFEKDARFMANIWLIGDAMNTNGGETGTIIMNASTGRVITGEETSLLMWSQIILGAKGLFLWCGHSPDMVEQRTAFGDGFQSYGVAYGYPYEYKKRYRWNVDSLRWEWIQPHYVRDTTLNDAGNKAAVDSLGELLNTYDFRSDELGPDWLDSNNRTGQWQLYNNDCYPALPTVLTKLYGNSNPANKWYTGTKSMRSALYDALQTVQRAQTELTQLKLRSWYSRGYRTWTVEPVANTFTKYVRLDSIKSRHPHRDPITRYPTWESKDSSFVEATLLQFGNDSTMLDSFAIGVLNRRCNPYYIDSVAGAPNIDYNTFPTYYEHWAATNAASDKSKRYRQTGSRTIQIPFVYARTDGKYRYLHVQEIGGARDSLQGIMPIDTVIGQDKPLAITFLPGEGKMLKVTVLPPNSATEELGYLTHSNQRKLVVFPTLQSPYLVLDTVDIDTTKMAVQRMVLGDSLRYHVVYHRRKYTNPGLTYNPLTVYYRRSVAYRRDLDTATTRTSKDIDMVPNIVWEEEIPVSEVLYRNEAMGMHPGFDSIYNRSCGYPALVVRPDATGFVAESSVHGAGAAPTGARGSVVYIVYGCADTSQAYGNPPIKMYFAETQIRADVSHAQQVADAKWYGGRILRREDVLNNALPADRPLMYKWATPTINASSLGNWYAWPAPSAAGPSGIRILHKSPNSIHAQALYFNLIPKGNNEATWYATHPSLNTYSRLDIGEPDAALVWQEGYSTEDGNAIRYTRLRRNATTTIPERFFNNGGPTTLLGTSLPANLVLSADSTIAELTSQARFPTSQHRYPVMFRHLSDFDLDTTNSRYNLGLVHHKAERIWFETKPTALTNWQLCRYMFDISDYTAINHANPALNNADTLYATTPSFLYHNVSSLLHPDITQGHQRTELLSTEPVWRDDSTMVVNFTVKALAGQPMTWHIIFGYRYYMNLADHDMIDLPAANVQLKYLYSPAHFSHQAARFSTSRFPGWQQNRRIFSDSCVAYWNESVNAPKMTLSSMHFFKGSETVQTDTADTSDGSDIQALQPVNLRGVSAGAGEYLAGDFVVQNANATEEKIKLEFHNDVEVYGGQPTDPHLMQNTATVHNNRTKVFRTDWFTLPFMSSVAVPVQTKGDASIATLGIERESDGYTYEFTPESSDGSEGGAGVQYLQASFVSDLNERYRFRLTPNDSAAELVYAEGGRTYPVNDVWLRAAGEDGLEENASYKGGSAKIIDLRKMVNINATDAVLLVYPTPARDVIHILVKKPVTTTSEQSINELVITDMLGSVVHKQAVQNADLITLNVGPWADGMYAVSLINTAKSLLQTSNVVSTVTIPIVR